MHRSIAALAALLAVSACGTITRGTEEDVAINVTPPNADVRTDIGMSCTGSCVLKVARKQSFTVTAEAPGYHPMSIPVLTKVSGGGTAGLVGNAVFGGLIGVGVDSISGAALDHYPNPVNINLQPADGSAPPPPAPAPQVVAASTTPAVETSVRMEPKVRWDCSASMCRKITE